MAVLVSCVISNGLPVRGMMAVRWEMSGAMAMAISMVMMMAGTGNNETLGFQDMVVERSDQNPVRSERESLDKQDSPSLPFTARRGREGRMFFISFSVSTARPCRVGGARSVRLHVGARGWEGGKCASANGPSDSEVDRSRRDVEAYRKYSSLSLTISTADDRLIENTLGERRTRVGQDYRFAVLGCTAAVGSDIGRVGWLAGLSNGITLTASF